MEKYCPNLDACVHAGGSICLWTQMTRIFKHRSTQIKSISSVLICVICVPIFMNTDDADFQTQITQIFISPFICVAPHLCHLCPHFYEHR